MAKKIKDTFRKTMSSYIVVCLNPFRKPDCKMGRIISTEDFKHLARKVSLEGTLYSIVMTVYTFIALRIIAVMTVTLDLKLQTISIV